MVAGFETSHYGEANAARARRRPASSRAWHGVAVARFHVAANGSAEVELIEPTPDAALNRVLLDTLRKWRFFPALKGGKPQASTIEIRIPISVR